MTEWNIESRARACQACGVPFLDQHPYHTVLFLEKAGYQRLDVCEACWTAQHSQGATSRKGFVSHWQGVFETPPAPADPIRKESAESLLRKLVDLNDPAYVAARFILAVMLERKRLLKVKAQDRRDGQRVFIYEQPATGDIFAIVDPELRLDQLEGVQREVAQLLEQGLNPPPPGAQPPATPAGAIAESPHSEPPEAASGERSAPQAGEVRPASFDLRHSPPPCLT